MPRVNATSKHSNPPPSLSPHFLLDLKTLWRWSTDLSYHQLMPPLNIPSPPSLFPHLPSDFKTLWRWSLTTGQLASYQLSPFDATTKHTSCCFSSYFLHDLKTLAKFIAANPTRAQMQALKLRSSGASLANKDEKPSS